MKLRTRCWRQAFFPFAKPKSFLLFTRRPAKICSWPADIVNISLKPGILSQQFCFPQNGSLAARCDHSSLMKSDGAKITGAEAAAVMRNRKFNLFNCRNSPILFVYRMVGPFVRELVNNVQFFLRQWQSRRILYHDQIAVALDHPFSNDSILLVLLLSAGNCISLFGFTYLLIGWAFHRSSRLIIARRNGIASSSDIRQFGNRFALLQTESDFNRLPFAHTKGKQICPGFNQNRRAYCVVPIVIMCKTAKRGFQSTDNQRNLRKKPPDYFGINDYSSIRTFPHFFTRRIGIFTAAPLCYRIMRHHGIQIPRIDHKSELRRAESLRVPAHGK